MDCSAHPASLFSAVSDRIAEAINHSPPPSLRRSLLQSVVSVAFEGLGTFAISGSHLGFTFRLSGFLLMHMLIVSVFCMCDIRQDQLRSNISPLPFGPCTRGTSCLIYSNFNVRFHIWSFPLRSQWQNVVDNQGSTFSPQKPPLRRARILGHGKANLHVVDFPCVSLPQTRLDLISGQTDKNGYLVRAHHPSFKSFLSQTLD